jgi:DNA-binding PadR family transcriptional regulator
MTITKAQLHTLRLLDQAAAHRVYRTRRAGDYTWKHENAHASLTPTLHRLLSGGYATVSSHNRDMAVLTEKGRAVIAARQFR